MATSTISLFDLYTAVEEDKITPEVKARATAEKKKILEERAKQAEKRAEKAKVNDPLKVKACEFLAKCPNVASEVGKAIGVSTSKASYLLRELAKDEYLTVKEVKSPTSKSKVKEYTHVKSFEA